jgi:hypothetical protein
VKLELRLVAKKTQEKRRSETLTCHFLFFCFVFSATERRIIITTNFVLLIYLCIYLVKHVLSIGNVGQLAVDLMVSSTRAYDSLPIRLTLLQQKVPSCKGRDSSLALSFCSLLIYLLYLCFSRISLMQKCRSSMIMLGVE